MANKYGGHIDYCDSSLISGWAIFFQATNFPTHVHIITTHRSIRITTTLHRLDIARLFGSAGMHGFTYRILPQDGTPSERILYAEFPDGSVINSSTRNGPHFSARSAVLYFMHIQKTAGTAFRNALNDVFNLDEVIYIYNEAPGISAEAYMNVSLCQLNHAKIVYGHFYFGLHEYQPATAKYTTILREPASRLRSQVAHISRSESKPISTVLEEFARFVELDNYYVRSISGISVFDAPVGTIGFSHLQLAKENIRRDFCSIGFISEPKFDDWLSTIFEKPVTLLRANVSDYSIDPALNPQFSLLIEWNGFDFQLYQWAKRHFLP